MTTRSVDALAEFDAALEHRLAAFETTLVGQIGAGAIDVDAARTTHADARALQQLARSMVAALVDALETAMSTKP